MAHDVAVIPGDGIGKEVVPAAIQVVDRAAELHGFEMSWTHYPWGCDHYLETGTMMPEDGLEQLGRHQAVFFGAVGHPDVPDHVSLWGLLIPMRRGFGQFVNLRPCKTLPGTSGPLARAAPIDLVVVRENVEGEYSEIGGRIYTGTAEEAAVQESVFTRRGVERILSYAFELARSRRGDLVAATKSNGIVHTMPFWDQICREVAEEYADVSWRLMHVDALAAGLVMQPERYDVVVGSNLFGDVLSEIGAAVTGSIGTAPSANIDPTREHPSLFEPIHGSAPDIAGTDVANPVGQIWSAVLMLEHLGETDAASSVMAALEQVTADPELRTRDLGGQCGTKEVADAVTAALKAL
ncbi:MAG TPA: tartrate dehydrogenase [Nocardioidaceae bacterium]|nr:tartrate dehydrogenase [Nocardioidaceae bacterium]